MDARFTDRKGSIQYGVSSLAQREGNPKMTAGIGILVIFELVVILVGIICLIKPIKLLRIRNRMTASVVMLAGVAMFITTAVLHGKYERAELRASDPQAYLEEIKGKVSNEEWWSEFQALFPEQYKAEMDRIAAERAEQERIAAEKKAEEERLAACQKDWSKCATQADLIEEYEGMTKATVACRMAADRLAKYGDPEWSWVPFGTYLANERSAQTGKVTLIDDQVKFQNGFGAMVRTSARCQYDLAKKEVIHVEVGG